MRKRCSQLTIRLRFDCDTIRQRYDHRATSMRFPFDVHSLAFTYLSLSSGRGKLYTILYYTILYYIPHCVSKRGLQNMGYNAAARLPDKDSKCWRTATASAERLEQHWTRRLIGASIDQWRVRLKACVRSGGDILNTCCTFICIDLRTSR